ncbi:MAG: cache domain-containing protein, partial [Huintestinicola sp.]
MKIRYKLIILTLIAAIVPLFILSSYANSHATSLASESQINILKSITADKSLYINDFMRELSINAKDFASDDGIREYVSKCSEEGYDGTWDGSEYTCELIQKYMKLHEDVNEMYILDNRGTVIAANDTMLMGSPADNKQELEGYLTNNNGISNVIAPKDGNGNTFYVVRRIYSSEGSNAGILCLRIDLSK